jgi:hypothetical protein
MNWELNVDQCRIGFLAPDQVRFQINGTTIVIRLIIFSAISWMMTIGSVAVETDILASQKI